jgi:hypothetical protein
MNKLKPQIRAPFKRTVTTAPPLFICLEMQWMDIQCHFHLGMVP